MKKDIFWELYQKSEEYKNFWKRCEKAVIGYYALSISPPGRYKSEGIIEKAENIVKKILSENRHKPIVVLDVGCSYGNNTSDLAMELKKLTDNVYVIGLDIWNYTWRNKNIRILFRNQHADDFIVAAGQHLPFCEKSIDVVIEHSGALGCNNETKRVLIKEENSI